MSANIIPLFPAATPTTPKPRARTYGVTRTGSCWHLVSSGRLAKCGIFLDGAVTLPPNLQPKGMDVCLTCQGNTAMQRKD